MAELPPIVITALVEASIKDGYSFLRQNYNLPVVVQRDVEKLTRLFSSIQPVLKDAENCTKLATVQFSLEKLRNVVYDSQDVMETLTTDASRWKEKQKVRILNSRFRATKYGYKLHTVINEILIRLTDIQTEIKGFHLDVNVEIRTLDNRITTPIVYKPDIVGRESDKDTIINMLFSEKSYNEREIGVIPIVGMGGLGKTTLAKLVFNSYEVRSHYSLRMWVCVTNNYDYKNIIKGMLESYTKIKVDDNSSINMLESLLLEFLINQRFLLVLDDVWNENPEDWMKLATILKQSERGSKVLVTSRSTMVSKVMGTFPAYQLGFMSEDDCLSLFKKVARVDTSLQGDLENIGKQIMNKCKGLPLAVCVMGGFLRHRDGDVEKWSWKYDSTILPSLRLSYDHLPYELKQCFSYCCLFPKEHVFNKKEMVALWKAASLITPRDYFTLDEIGSEIFETLLSRSFFQIINVGDTSTCRMHDLIHELALSVSEPYFYQIENSNFDLYTVANKVRHVALLHEDAPKSIMKQLGSLEKLRTLLSPVKCSIDFTPVIDQLFRNWKYLQTLDLSSNILTMLPESVGKLKLLNYLDLSETEIKKLPNSLCKLYNLQTLKLLGCPWLFELPKDFGKLVKLEHLELDDMFWYKLLKVPLNIGSLKNLQNLHVFILESKKGCDIDELRELLHLKGSLHISKLEYARNTREASLNNKKDLVKLTFEWSIGDESPQDEVKHRENLQDLQPHPNIVEVCILGYLGDKMPSWLNSSAFQKLTTLFLKNCSNCKILSLGELPLLQELVLKGLVKLEEWSEAEYNNLLRLEIKSCPNLSRVPSSFQKLKLLKIKKCDLLEALPCTPSLMFIILVENMVMKDFNEQILIYQSVDDQGQQVIKPSYIEVLEMKIINCSMFPEMPKQFAPQKLDISGCPLLTTLPRPELSRRLQHLAIDGCIDDRLVRAIPATSSLLSLVISNIQNLNSLPKLSHIPGLRSLYIQGCNDLVSLSDYEEPFQGLNSLLLFSIRDCPKLVSLTVVENMLPTSLTILIIGSCSNLTSIGSNDVLKNLTSLRDLYIEHCPILPSLPEGGVPTSLQHLKIEGCPILMSACQDKMTIMDIPDLELKFPRVSANQNSSSMPSSILQLLQQRTNFR